MSVQVQDHPSVKVAISGISGAGKSTLFEKLLKRERAKWIFLFDQKDGDMARRFRVAPCYDADDLERAAVKGGMIIFDPSLYFPGRAEEGFDVFCRWFWEVCRVLKGKKILAADELQDLCDLYSKPDALCKILDQGRTYQMDAIFIVQAMNAVHNQVRKQITEIFAMRQEEENAIKWLLTRGFQENEIKNLRHGEWLYANKNTGEKARGGKAFTPKNAGRDLRGL